MRPAVLILAAVLALLSAAAPLAAQSDWETTLSAPVTAFPVPAVSDYVAGYVSVTTSISVTPTVSHWPNAGTTYTETVRFVCTDCTAGKVQFSTGGAYTTVVAGTSYQLASRAIKRTGPFSFTVTWRYLLDWTTDTAPDSHTFHINYNLTQT
ncbi:MAG TPA: hypothetical protein VF832_12455 [Longimicrobiales bacterium]